MYIEKHERTAAAQKPSTDTALAVTLARGDGIGPEISDAVMRILDEAKANLRFEEVVIGMQAYEAGHTNGITPDTWDSLNRTKLMLKGPVTTPQFGGFKSVNVTLRKVMGLFANVRPCISYAPLIDSAHSALNIIIVRENEEDLYAGIEHQASDEVVQCLKIISKPGCERIARYAFELARHAQRKRVTCMTKDNIMKLTDGLFHKSFDAMARQYPGIDANHLLVDIGAARLATQPEKFDVILTSNLYGDILSDLVAEVAGSVGLAGSGNIGSQASMFEAVHGSAPDIAGKDVANPSGLLQAALYMLAHAGRAETAQLIYNAWLATLEAGVHTSDISSVRTKRKVGTQAFAREVVARLGQQPKQMRMLPWTTKPIEIPQLKRESAAKKEFVGIDVFLHDRSDNGDMLARKLGTYATDEHAGLRLKMISNRGVVVWPHGHAATNCVDHWRLRFVCEPQSQREAYMRVSALLGLLGDHGLDVVKTENLYNFDGKPSYSAAQGQ
jgi:isocitrate dehydrogenase